MGRKLVLAAALALLLTCGPTAVTTAPSASPAATLTPIASSDLITLREGGQQPSLAVRKVANSELVRSIPDGLLMPDGITLLIVDGGGASTLVKKIDRRTGATTASHTVDGTWQLYRGFPSFTGASADGSHVALHGSSYNFTDASGAWTARTTLGVLDLATWRIVPIELVGRFNFDAISNDGMLVYLDDFTSNPARLRVYDVAAHALGAMQGDALPSSELMSLTHVDGFAFAMMSSTESVEVRPSVITVTGIAKLARIELSSRTVTMLRLPLDRVPTGEDSLAWSLVPSRDGKALYVVNPQAAAIQEIDVASLQIRRSGSLSAPRSERGFLDAALALVHPSADAKMGFGTGAALSPDGSKIYVLGAQGVWVVDLATLAAKMITRDGAYETLKVSPDGTLLYVLSRETGVVSAVDAQSGAILGSMQRYAFPSEIVAVDAG